MRVSIYKIIGLILSEVGYTIIPRYMCAPARCGAPDVAEYAVVLVTQCRNPAAAAGVDDV